MWFLQVPPLSQGGPKGQVSPPLLEMVTIIIIIIIRSLESHSLESSSSRRRKRSLFLSKANLPDVPMHLSISSNGSDTEPGSVGLQKNKTEFFPLINSLSQMGNRGLNKDFWCEKGAGKASERFRRAYGHHKLELAFE